MRVDMIAVLILHMDLISGKINIQLIPEYPIVNESVTLSVTGITGNIWFFTWFKGPNATSQYQILTYVNGSPIGGAKYFSRVSAFSNGSILIKDLHIEDQGNYKVKIQAETQEDTEISLKLYESVTKPVIAASHSEIKENDFVSLTCVSANADKIIWIKSSSETIHVENGNIEHDNGTVIFSKIKLSDEGKYECRAENLVSRSSSEVYTLTISHVNESKPYKSAAVTAGIISAAILGSLLIISVSFFLYKRYGPHGKKQMKGPPIHRPDPYAIYNNILDPTTGLEPKDEPLYMCLQYCSEGTYNELQK